MSSLPSIGVLTLLTLGGCTATIPFDCPYSGPDYDCDGVDDDCDGSVDEDAPTDDWCERLVLPGIYELDGIDPDLSFDDLAPLGLMVEEAEVVGLGYPVHASGGFHEANHRLIRYLVEEHGHRAVAMTVPWDDAEKVAEAVAGGDPFALLAVRLGLPLYERGHEMVAFVQWLHDWNIAHPDDPVAFFGVDVNGAWVDGPAVEAFLEEADPEVGAAWAEPLSRCHWTNWASEAQWEESPDAWPVDEADHLACTAALEEVEAWLVEEEEALVASTSAEALALARLHLVGLAYSEEVAPDFHADQESAWEDWDRAMYDIFSLQREMRYPVARSVLWTNSHTVMAHAEDQVASPWLTPNLGGMLVDELGDGYVPIGLLAYYVSWNYGEGVGQVPEPEGEDNLQRMLHRLWYEHLLVDLEFPGAEEPWLDPDASYTMGFEGAKYVEVLVPAEHYRALVFLDSSTEMHPL